MKNIIYILLLIAISSEAKAYFPCTNPWYLESDTVNAGDVNYVYLYLNPDSTVIPNDTLIVKLWADALVNLPPAIPKDSVVVKISFADFILIPLEADGTRKVPFTVPAIWYGGKMRIYTNYPCHYSGQPDWQYSFYVTNGVVMNTVKKYTQYDYPKSYRYFDLTGRQVTPTQGMYFYKDRKGLTGKVWIGF